MQIACDFYKVLLNEEQANNQYGKNIDFLEVLNEHMKEMAKSAMAKNFDALQDINKEAC